MNDVIEIRVRRDWLFLSRSRSRFLKVKPVPIPIPVKYFIGIPIPIPISKGETRPDPVQSRLFLIPLKIIFSRMCQIRQYWSIFHFRCYLWVENWYPSLFSDFLHSDNQIQYRVHRSCGRENTNSQSKKHPCIYTYTSDRKENEVKHPGQTR